MKALIALFFLSFLGAFHSGAVEAQNEAFRARMNEIRQLREEMAKTMSGTDFEKYAKAALGLARDFPSEPESYDGLAEVAAFMEGKDAMELAQRVKSSTAAKPETKEQAGLTIKKLEHIGKPLDLKFTALDGRLVDLAKLKGKVVLIDFWATWCPPCVASVPHLREIYAKYHDKGFEIVGLSLDKDEKALKAFLGKQKMVWPQRFDGEPWERSVAPRYGITSIPAVWLVDKQGIVRYVAVYDGLESKVKQLLEE